MHITERAKRGRLAIDKPRLVHHCVHGVLHDLLRRVVEGIKITPAEWWAEAEAVVDADAEQMKHFGRAMARLLPRAPSQALLLSTTTSPEAHLQRNSDTLTPEFVTEKSRLIARDARHMDGRLADLLSRVPATAWADVIASNTLNVNGWQDADFACSGWCASYGREIASISLAEAEADTSAARPH